MHTPFPTPTSTPNPKNLTAEEAHELTGYLEIISGGNKSVEGAADTILRDVSLGPEVWDTFFQEYFSEHHLTEALYNYLNYRAFWISEIVGANLQQGLYTSLADIISKQTAVYLESDKSSLRRDSPIVESIFCAHKFLYDMLYLQVLGVEYGDDIFDFYENLVKDIPLIYGSTSVDLDKYPFAGVFQAQAHINLAEALDLTNLVSNQIIEALGLTGIRKEIFYDYGVMVIDNHGLDETQLQVIKSILSSVPKELYDLRTISVNDFLWRTSNERLLVSSRFGVNIFGIGVGISQENGFPSDVSLMFSDVFSLVAVHELNHRVNVHYIDNNDRLRQRQETLLTQAGTNKKNYLRSMFDDPSFFQNAPQEFFASISNQYFANSEHTLLLGMQRYLQGTTEPLNQFLFFADVYSRGGLSTLFYTLDTAGNLTHTDVPIVRDSEGRIIGLHFEGTDYNFLLDADGNVTSASPVPTPTPTGFRVIRPIDYTNFEVLSQHCCVNDVYRWIDEYWTGARPIEVSLLVVHNTEGLTEADEHTAAIESYGMDLLNIDYFLGGTTDFYPVLTKALAQNPDLIAYTLCTERELVLKQIIELGYRDLILSPL